jgi:hypothetical protein
MSRPSTSPASVSTRETGDSRLATLWCFYENVPFHLKPSFGRVMLFMRSR